MKKSLKECLTELFAILLSLSLPLVIVSCVYEETFQCDRCGDTFSEKSKVYDFDLNSVCPSCLNKQMLEINSGEYGFCSECYEYYSSSDLSAYGLCESCCDKYLRKCCRCGDLDYSWSVYPEYFLCGRCLEEAVHCPEVVDALQTAFE